MTYINNYIRKIKYNPNILYGQTAFHAFKGSQSPTWSSLNAEGDADTECP